MRNLLLLIFLSLGFGIIQVYAQDNENPTPSSAVITPDQQEDDKILMRSEELPDDVKKALEAPDFKGWLINATYYDRRNELYEIEMKKGTLTKIIKFDKEGKKVD